VDLQPTGLVNPHGLAFDPTTGHRHVLNPSEQILYELTRTGQVVAVHDLSEFDLGNPQAMVFAPSSDLTDDPSIINLYLADRGADTQPGQEGSSLGLVGAGFQIYLPLILHSSGEGRVGVPGGQITELSFTPAPPPLLATSVFQASLVQTIDTSLGLKELGYAVVNLGSDKPVLLCQAIVMLEEIIGKKSVIQHQPSQQADVWATWANISRAKSLLGWEPRYNLQDGLSQLVEWYQQNRTWAQNVVTAESA
jgi:hypothetical protein